MKNRRSEKSKQELFEFAAQVLGNHYKKQVLAAKDCFEENLKNEIASFKASRQR